MRGMDLKENIMHRDKIGIHQVVPATDLRYVKDRLGMQMNIALTRALGVVRIVGEEAVLRQDQVLSGFLK